MILGVDVSSLQGAIEWGRLADQGVRFAYLRCTTGNERGRDSYFSRNVERAKAAGVYVGGYHFGFPLPEDPANPGRSPLDQARRAFAEFDQLGRDPGELPPALDLEWPPKFARSKTGDITNEWEHWHVTAESITGWALMFLAEAERLWGRPPLVYTYPDFWRALGAEGKRPEWRRYPLWIASYPAAAKVPGLPREGLTPASVGPWEAWTVWQFSADGGARLDGCVTDIDRDAFNGTLDDLRRLARIDPDEITRPEGVDMALTMAARRELTSEAVQALVDDEDEG